MTFFTNNTIFLGVLNAFWKILELCANAVGTHFDLTEALQLTI